MAKKNYKIKVNGIIANISTGNLKMDNTLIFNLPAKTTCPGSTELCRGKCYACKNQRFANVVASREQNLEASKGSEFVDAVVSFVTKYFGNESGFLRVHESGDFYSQEYLDKWLEIARRLPNVKFLAFTKSYMLDFSKVPDNFKMIYSVFPDTKYIVNELPIAYAGNCIFRNPSKTVPCPGKCDKCRVCWFLEGCDVHFKFH